MAPALRGLRPQFRAGSCYWLRGHVCVAAPLRYARTLSNVHPGRRGAAICAGTGLHGAWHQRDGPTATVAGVSKLAEPAGHMARLAYHRPVSVLLISGLVWPVRSCCPGGAGCVGDALATHDGMALRWRVSAAGRALRSLRLATDLRVRGENLRLAPHRIRLCPTHAGYGCGECTGGVSGVHPDAVPRW